LTSPTDVEKFIAADIDILAPSIGNIHGDYGPRGPELDLKRLEDIQSQCQGRVEIALHGTNDFSPSLLQQCVKAGVAKININKLLLEVWNIHLTENAHKPLTELIEEGMEVLQNEVERWMVVVGSYGRY
jgi:fructose-bisphosphate aldolase class II